MRPGRHDVDSVLSALTQEIATRWGTTSMHRRLSKEGPGIELDAAGVERS